MYNCRSIAINRCLRISRYTWKTYWNFQTKKKSRPKRSKTYGTEFTKSQNPVTAGVAGQREIEPNTKE